MLEIFLLIFLCRKMGEIMRGKARNPIGLQILTVCGWFGGEIFGAIAWTVILLIAQEEKAMEDGLNIMTYVCALICAALSVGVVFLIAMLIPAKAIPVQEVVYEDTEFSD